MFLMINRPKSGGWYVNIWTNLIYWAQRYIESVYIQNHILRFYMILFQALGLVNRSIQTIIDGSHIGLREANLLSVTFWRRKLEMYILSCFNNMLETIRLTIPYYTAVFLLLVFWVCLYIISSRIYTCTYVIYLSTALLH